LGKSFNASTRIKDLSLCAYLYIAVQIVWLEETETLEAQYTAEFLILNMADMIVPDELQVAMAG
jgi:hypothetical protein